MAYKQIVYETEKGIGTITLNRPERLNAWTWVMAQEVRDAMYRAARDQDIRVILLTGAGKGFCAGADMEELKGTQDNRLIETKTDSALPPEQEVSVLMRTKTEGEIDPENADCNREDFRKRYTYLLGIQKPIIAAINGAAAGLGFILALYCDIRFASKTSKFSTSFSRRGLIAEHGVSWILPRIVGISNALDLLFSSRLINAQEAFQMGLVNNVFPAETFMEEVMAYASELAEKVSPRSMHVIKRQVYNAQFQGLAEACAQADEELLLSLKSEDFREGIAHFLEKRSPTFTGK